jgi:hypothetical protein
MSRLCLLPSAVLSSWKVSKLCRSEWGMKELIWEKKILAVREVRKIYLDINDLNEHINRNKALSD